MTSPRNPACLVDVIVTTRDRLRYLKAALRSLEGQTLRRWRLIVVDGGSRDGTAAWVQKAYPKALLKRARGNPGPAALMNLGLRAARAPFVAFLESDDLWTPRHLSRAVAALSSSPALKASVAGFGIIDARGRRVETRLRPPPDPFFKTVSGLERPFPFSTAVFREEVFELVGAFDEGLRWHGWDVDFQYRAALRLGAGAFAALAEPLVLYRKHAGQLSGLSPASQRGREALLDGACLLRRYDSRFRANGLK